MLALIHLLELLGNDFLAMYNRRLFILLFFYYSIAGPPENHAGAKYEVEMIAKGTPVNPSPSSASSSQYGGGDMWGGATSQMYGMGSYYGGATAGAYAGTAAYGQSYGGYYGATASDPYSMQQAAYGQTGSTDQQSSKFATSSRK